MRMLRLDESQTAIADRRSLATVCAAAASRPEPALSSYAARLPAALTAAIHSWEKRSSCVLESLLLAAWSLLVSRLTGETSVVVAETAATTHLLHKVTVLDDGTIGGFIHAVHVLRQANLLTGPRAESDGGEVTDGSWSFRGSKCPTDSVIGLAFSLSKSITLHARSDVIEQQMLESMVDLLIQLLGQLTASSECALNDCQLLNATQRDQILIEWNNTAHQRAAADTVHGVFSAQAQISPQKPALEFGQENLTYAELDQRSSAWAAALRGAGVIRGSIVAVLVPRSADAVVALLAVLKAGGAYLPLDEAYPIDRLRFMLEDSNAAVVLTDRTRNSKLMPASVIEIHIDEIDKGTVSELPGDEAQSGGDLAYIMYTSGSTGMPKGVEISHAAIIRLVREAQYVTLDSTTAFLHAAPLGFDASTLEIWGPLLNSGRCVVHDELIPTGPGLAATIERHKVTSAWLTAALFNALVDDDARYLVGLRELLIGGEALSVSHVTRAYELLPCTQITNGYGPTECTTFAATYRIPRDVSPEALSIPIGRPISDTSLYVLNRRMRPIPVGFVGELFIGGAGLARGYHNRPELTAERFVPHPISGHPGRLYRTGDLVRFRTDGNIDFIGRADSQVKIRGYRIEIGEIEATLRLHPSVRSCAVIAREDRPGDRRLVAYIVPTDSSTALESLRQHLARQLPEFMRPSAYVLLAALPITANGKLDRRALPAPAIHRPELAEEFRAPANEHETRICRLFESVLGVTGVGARDSFFELGGNSLLALRVITALRDAFSTRLSTTSFFQHPAAEPLARLLAGESLESAVSRRRVRRDVQSSEPIAIVGMAGRFPGADDVEEFWRNVCGGKESITMFSDAIIDPSVSQQLRADPSYVKARGVLNGVDMFDAAFFGVNPKEAELMDPQQRKFLEICWECLEHAGYAPDAIKVPVGVYAGMHNATYFQRHVMHYPELIDKVGEFQVMVANEKDYIATRVAHRLNLTGPAISVNTACSTSLVAVCQAFDALRNGQCDMALAGGVSILCPPNSGYLYQEGAMLSPDGHTRSFDVDAKGTVFSDGAAVVLLKRLSDAVADGDTIYAVIRGAGVNNDGAHKASFTAPSAVAQAEVIAFAQQCAGVHARSISYVEAHGTATPLGDPIEIEGLTRAFRRDTDETGFCAIGSVKSNVGHLVIAAGATGLIKTALALKNAVIPPSINYRAPNRQIDFRSTPFYVAATLTEWKTSGHPRRAGVSSFGVGGTNAHVIVEEPPAILTAPAATGPYLLLVSARTEPALAAAASRLADHLAAHPELDPADVAYTLRVGRKNFQHRGVAVVDGIEDAIAVCGGREKARFLTRFGKGRVPDIAFMFPGQGAQYAGMGITLYDSDTVFRNAFDECAHRLMPYAGFDLREKVFAGADEALIATAVTQPAIFAIEYCLAQFWLARAVKPVALIGHSVGEFVAAVLGGVMRLEDALRLLACRGRLMQALPAGSMLSIRLPSAQVLRQLPAGLSIAAVNSPQLTVVAGPTAQIDEFRTTLERDNVVARVLQTSHAFHSAMMDPVIAPFEAEVSKTSLSVPLIPIASTLTGTWLKAEEATDARYWARHLREPVQFSPALRAIAQNTSQVLLEIGPRSTLATLARQHFSVKEPKPEILASLADSVQSEASAVAAAVGTLWACGVEVDTTALKGEQGRRRVALPTYPFERRRFWVDAVRAPPVASPTRNEPNTLSVSILPGIAALEKPMAAEVSTPTPGSSRRDRFIERLRKIIDETVGVDIEGTDPAAMFVELGLDSLALTQIALQLQKAFAVKITFRQLMENYSSLGRLADHLDTIVAKEAASSATSYTATPSVAQLQPQGDPAPHLPAAGTPSAIQQVIEQQMQIMGQQLALLRGLPAGQPAAIVTAAPAIVVPAGPSEEASGPMMKYDVNKAFGAIARIHTRPTTELTERQKARLETFMRRYVARTRKSKDYTAKYRSRLADPRVVNGFRPQLKEIIYQIVVDRSKGAHVWDIDGNEYVDALNGFGMSLFGWQPPFVLEAVRNQIEAGYEIGPQHPLAGEVAELLCEVTGFDRAGLCNTGSEAVMGAMRIARTVTGRSKIALFTGSYHGIFDEVIVRGTKNLRAVPAAPGIMPSSSENVLVLDYGTPESLSILKSHAHELAAVLIEPVQSRRPDFQPRDFLRQLREITQESGTLFIFDEVVTGFRAHPRGAQAMFDIDADLATYGKVVGGGFPIGVIAGKREYMDALDGGSWQFGDESIPTVGVTYFAGTFVRHPLALAAAKAVLNHIKEQGAAMQESLNARTASMARELNAFCEERGAPIVIKHFSSVWKTIFTEDHHLQDLLFAMMRSRGIHILDNFPCFFTTAHTEADFSAIMQAFKESVRELQEADFLPQRTHKPRALLDASKPPVPGARLGRDVEGNPTWFVPSPDNPGKFVKVGG